MEAISGGFIDVPFEIKFDDKLSRHFNRKWLKNTEMIVIVSPVVLTKELSEISYIPAYKGVFREKFMLRIHSDICDYIPNECQKEININSDYIGVLPHFFFYNEKENKYARVINGQMPLSVEKKLDNPLIFPYTTLTIMSQHIAGDRLSHERKF